MAAIYTNGGNRWNILGFNFTKRDALSSLYKISMSSVRCVGMAGPQVRFLYQGTIVAFLAAVPV
jgi:hypothetical protein